MSEIAWFQQLLNTTCALRGDHPAQETLSLNAHLLQWEKR